MTKRTYPSWLNICSGITIAILLAGIFLLFLGSVFAPLLLLLGFAGVWFFGELASKFGKSIGNKS